MKARAAIILIQKNKIALIERHRSGRHYFVFPGGKVEANETPAEAATRETEEELGLVVKIDRMVAEIWYLGTPQYYFLSVPISGQFGTGNGKELGSTPDSEKGTYQPVWLEVCDLLNRPVLPELMAEFVWKSYRKTWPEEPLIVTDQPSDEVIKG